MTAPRRVITRRGRTEDGPALALRCGHTIPWTSYRESQDRGGAYPCAACADERHVAMLASPSHMGRAFRRLMDAHTGGQTDITVWSAEQRQTTA